MTHDWFSHLEEGHNAPQYMNVGCASQKVNDIETPLTAAQVAQSGLPARRRHRQVLCRCRRSARQFQGQRRRPFRTCAQDVPQQQHGVVGCVANLRLRLDLDRAGEARSARSGAPADAAAARQDLRRRQPRLFARAFGYRSQEPRLEGPGSGGLSGQLDARLEFSAQRVLARTQSVRR